jgi:hypothetical protein
MGLMPGTNKRALGDSLLTAVNGRLGPKQQSDRPARAGFTVCHISLGEVYPRFRALRAVASDGGKLFFYEANIFLFEYRHHME